MNPNYDLARLETKREINRIFLSFKVVALAEVLNDITDLLEEEEDRKEEIYRTILSVSGYDLAKPILFAILNTFDLN